MPQTNRPQGTSTISNAEYVWGLPQVGTVLGQDGMSRSFIPGPDYAYKLPLQLIDGMPSDQYVEQIKPQILDARDFAMFDTRFIAAATNLTAGNKKFFTVENGGSELSLDGSVTVANKTDNYTNMVESGKVEGGNTMIVDSLQVAIYLPHRDFNAFTANSAFPSTGAPAATDTNSGTLNLLALNYGTYLTFSEPNRGNFAEGNIFRFPSVEQPSGFFGGQTTEGAAVIGGDPQYLRYVRVLQNLHHFDMTLECFSTITFPIQVIIQIALCGIKLVG